MIIYSCGYKISSHDYNRNTLLPWNRENRFTYLRVSSELWIVLFDLSYRSQLKWQTPKQEFIKLAAWQLCPKRYHLFKKKRRYRAIPGQLPLRVVCLSSLVKRDIIFTILTSVKYRWIIYGAETWRFVFHIYSSWLTFAHRRSTMLQSVYNRAFISYRLSLGEATDRRRILISLDFNSSSFYYVSPALPCAFARSSPNWVGRLFLRCS